VSAFFKWFPIISVVLLACSGCTETPPDPSARDAFESRATAHTTILSPQLKTRWLQFGHGISGRNQLGSM
jgi:hypothetical protein